MITTTYGEQKEFTTTDGRDNTTAIIEITDARGRAWMDRNLGAESVGEHGDLYQWGRAADGHQKRNSGVTQGESDTDQPTHGLFILTRYQYGTYGNITTPYNDWRTPQNNNLWQGVNGVNNPCPTGFRIPTKEEWETGPPDGLPEANLRYYQTGQLLGQYSLFYWSSTVIQDSYPGEYSWAYIKTNVSWSGSLINRGAGYSVRCIKD
jgi:hypothetical protein